MPTPTTLTAPQARPDETTRWLARRRAASALACRPVSLDELRAWRFRAGRLVHATGGFFAVAGLRAEGPGLEGGAVEQPIVVQPEIGVLGFLLRGAGRSPEVLVQAKAEPGNVGAVQLAPTVQATVSNYTRLHGGAPTSYLDRFLDPPPDARVVRDTLQSEQGTRFLGKYNRNATVAVPGDGPAPVSDAWRWVSVPDLCVQLGRDFAVNTDARSVLATADWSALAGEGGPFGRWRGADGFGAELLSSWEAAPARAETSERELLARLAGLRARRTFERELVPVEELRGWRRDAGSLVDDEARWMRVRGFRVHVRGREVEDWDQPLVESLGRGEATLLCQRRGGVLHFLLRGRTEVGFLERVQLGPTVQLEGRERRAARRASGDPLVGLADAGAPRIACVQSDEGGRFHRSTARYAVVELPEEAAVPAAEEHAWATLRQLHRLAGRKGVLTNEARSLLSLLIVWL